MEIKSRIIKTEDVNWRDLEWLQDNLKEMKKADFEKLKQSLKVNSFIMPFHVWQQNGTTWILDGHHRKKAMEELAKEGIDIPKKLPATFIRVKNEKEAKKLVLIYSSIYARATDEGLYEYINANDLNFDDLKLEIDLPDFDLDRFETGYMTDEPVEDEPPSLPEKAKSKTGDLYELGKHRLLCGDSTKRKDVEKLMGGKKADMVFTDPPYGVNYSGGIRKIENDNLMGDDFRRFLALSFENIDIFLKDTGVVYVWHGDAVPSFLIILEEFCKRWQHLNEIIWNKNCASLGYCDYRYRHECISYGSKNGKHKFYGDKTEVDVWDCSKGNTNAYEHPTQKPIQLGLRAIRNSSKLNDISLDLFGGSGSTLIACEQASRICYGMEIDPHYCDVIVTRYCNFVKDNKIKLNGKAIAWK